MKNFFLLLAFILSCHVFAQTTVLQELNEKMMDEEETIDEDTQSELTLEADSVLVTPDAWDANFDNLLNSWYITNHTNKLNNSGYQEVVPVNDSVYIERLSKLPNIIELPYNSTVRNCINLYVERRRDLTERMLGLETFYFPMIEEMLDKYGLPLELKYLVIVESALNPIALSRAGASGLWQFIISTGKNYGLEINSLIDERRDPIKSTDAACRHLKDLYETYEDWNLALAAYNCGGGNVNKAIKRANGKKDYWAIYNYLPKETRLYLPYFIAANYVMNYYAHHQLYPVQPPLPLATDTVMINQMIHFDQIAEVLQIGKDTIRALNPQYKREIIPGNFKPQILRLPAMQAYAFVEKEDEIAAHRANELFTNRTIAVGNNTTAGRTEKITHKVTTGESVSTIAHKYGVTTSNVLRWNNLKSSRVNPGKILTLYIDNGGYAIGNSGTQTASKTTTSKSILPQNNKSSDLSIDTTQYKVKSGDSFYSIAQRYPGYSYTDLMKLNNVNNPNLKVGQYIIVPKI